MLILVPLEKKFMKKLDFSHGLKLWVWKIIYQKIRILDICQGLMIMVECMEGEGLPHHKGETKNKFTYKKNVGSNSRNKGQNKQKWGHGKLGFHDYMEKF